MSPTNLTQFPKPASSSDTPRPAASGMVQSLGLFSSTALVIGSMIGSGIFIVDADIARGTNSPALFLGAWVVTGVLTIIAALSYGELASMMPKAGGQYVYLRESLGPLWGFLYGWTLFLVIQTGTIAAVCVAFGKFLGVFFPAFSTTHWVWHIAHVPALKVGPMVLGNMEIGVSTANLTAIFIVFFLAIVNIFGVRLGAMIQNVFTSAKALVIGGTHHSCVYRWAQCDCRGCQLWAGAERVLEERGVEFAASCSGWDGRARCAGESGSHSCRCAGWVAVFGGCLEQTSPLLRWQAEEPEAQHPAVSHSWYGVRTHCLPSCFSSSYLLVLPMQGDPHGDYRRCAGHSIRGGRPRRNGGAGADFQFGRSMVDGRRHSDLHIRMRKRYDPCRRARLLRYEPGRTLLPSQSASCTRATRRQSRG